MFFKKKIPLELNPGPFRTTLGKLKYGRGVSRAEYTYNMPIFCVRLMDSYIITWRQQPLK